MLCQIYYYDSEHYVWCVCVCAFFVEYLSELGGCGGAIEQLHSANVRKCRGTYLGSRDSPTQVKHGYTLS